MTINQKLKNKKNQTKKMLKPQVKGIVLKVVIMKPTKPNSAQRKVAIVKITTGEIIKGYIVGIGHNLNQHSLVLLKPGKTQDLPGVKYKVIRGVYDTLGVFNRKTSRSKYGVKSST